MNKKGNLIISLILICFLYLVISNYDIVKNTVYFSYKLFLNNVFPTLFIFFVLSSLFINYGFVDLMTKIFGKIFSRIFKIDPNATFIFFMSLFTGSPSNAKYVKDLYDKNIINEITGTKILLFTHFTNPLFIIGTISEFISLKVAYIVLFCTYISNIIVGLIFRNTMITKQGNKINKIKSKNFSICFKEAIINGINTILLIYGTIIIFLVVSTIITNKLSLNSFYQTIFKGVLEMTQGLKFASTLNISNKIKALLMTSFISFGGISVHMQIISIISNTKIRYQPFLVARLIHTSISCFLVNLIL